MYHLRLRPGTPRTTGEQAVTQIQGRCPLCAFKWDVSSSQGSVLRGFLRSIWKGPIPPKDTLESFSSLSMLNELQNTPE